MRYLAAAARIAAIGVTAACGGGSGASTEDAHGTRDADAASDAAAGCAGRGCDLACDPAETWVAFTRGVGTGQGDSEPATPDEVGDGLWHLFVGVNLSTTATPDVYIYDLTAASPTDAFAQPASPLVMMRDSYDVLGSEAPSYLRADVHREYIYYCAIQSYSPLSASVAALRRTDSGAWQKLGPIAPHATGELTQCEPTAVVRRSDGHILLGYLAVNSTSGGGIQQIVRDSADPESFPLASATVAIDSDIHSTTYPARLATSYDPFAGVYRTAFDRGYPYAVETLQTWSVDPIATAADLARAAFLHDGNHATHPALHVDGSACTVQTCPQGAVLQPSKAIFPNADDVIFFYSGWASPPQLQINAQKCTRL